MNSPIDRAGEPARLQVREQRVLSWQSWKERQRGSGRGRCLPDQHGPEGETGSSPRGLWPGSLAPPQRRCTGPSPGVGEFGDICSHPARACCPSCHGPWLCHAPQKPQLREPSLRGRQRSSSPRGSLLREKQGPFPNSLPAPQGAPGHSPQPGKDRQPRPGWAKGLPAQGHTQRSVHEAKALAVHCNPTFQSAILNLRLR